MKLSIRIALLFAAFTVAFAGTLTVILGYVSENRIEAEDRRWATLLTEAVSDTIARSVIDGDVVHARDVLLGIIDRSEEIRYIFVEGFDGEIVAHTFELGFPRSLLALTVGSERDEEPLILLSDGSHVSDLSEPIIAGMSARLHIGINHEIATAAAGEIAYLIALLAAAFSVLGTLMGIIAGRKIAAPLERVARSMFAYGQDGVFAPFETRPSGAEELMLTSAFEKMAESRQKEDEALQLREAALNDAQRIAHLGSWDWNIETGELWWSDEIYQIFRVDPAEFVASYEAFLSMIHPDDRDRVVTAVDNAVANRAPYSARHRIVRPDGTERIVQEQGEIYVFEGTGHRHMSGVVHDITELENAFADLRHNKDVLAEAQKLAKIGHWDSRADRSSTYWSDQLYEILGLDPDQAALPREAFAEYVHPDDKAKLLELAELPPEEDWPPNSEFRVIVDGQVKYIRINRKVRYDEDGEIERIIGTVQDVTSSKKMEGAVRKNEERLAYAQKIAHVGNFEWDPNGDNLWWSDEAYRIFGFDPQAAEIDYPVFMESVHPDDRAYVADKIARMLEGEPYDIEHRIVLADGGVRTLNEQGVVEWDEDGKPVIVRGIMFDITERRKAFATSEQLGRIIEDSTNEIYIFDMETLNFTSVNRSARENLGYDMDELKDMTPVDFKPQYSEKEFRKIIQPLISGRERAIKFETEHQRKDGSLYDVEVRLQMTRKGGAPAFFASVLDITERLKAAESARQLSQQLTHAARLGTIGGMATGLAHEINQPLSAISNYAQVCVRLLENGRGTTEEIIDDMNKISQQVERAAEIIKWLRKTVKRDAVDKTSLDINACVSEIVELMGGEFRARKSLVKFDLCNDLPPVRVNKVQIQQVLVNLIQNSLNAAHPSRAHSLVIKSCRTEQGMIEIDVEDNGPGVPSEIQEEIFAPFFSTRGEGLGFGLSVSRSIIEAHGGELWLDPEFAKGAAFRFVVPVSDEKVI